MRLDYGTMTSPRPIRLSIGCTIRKPTIDLVWDIGFETLGFYESFLSLTPEVYYTKINPEAGKVGWEHLSEKDKESVTLYSIVASDENLRNIYLDLFHFFIEEPVLYEQGFFIILNKSASDLHGDIRKEDVQGAINESLFPQVLNILKQVCGMDADDEEDESQIKFKNKTAQKLYEKMKTAKKAKKHGKHDPNLSLPNIISAVATRHPSINYTNIGQLTIYQVMDSFDRLRNNAFYEIDKTRVSVWGDEKKTFKPETWYENEYDKK